MTKISQREARELKRRVARLENELDRQRNAWATEWPGGAHIRTVPVDDVTREAVRVSRLLKHAVVVTINSNGCLNLYATSLGSDEMSGGGWR